METRDYTQNADVIARLVQARILLIRATRTIDALLGYVTDETIAPGNSKSTASALGSSQNDARRGADLLAGLAQLSPLAPDEKGM